MRHLAPLVFALAAPAVAQTGDLAHVQSYLKAVTSMTADFAQTDASGKTLTGTLTLKRPGKIRFQYQPGVPILIVSDGRALTFIDYKVRQVSRWPIGSSPLGILLDPSRDLSGIAHIVSTGDPRVVLAEARDPRHPDYGAITLAFARDSTAPAGLRLNGWVALDGQGNRTVIRLSNQRFNVPIRDQAFTWRDPRGAGAHK